MKRIIIVGISLMACSVSFAMDFSSSPLPRTASLCHVLNALAKMILKKEKPTEKWNNSLYVEPFLTPEQIEEGMVQFEQMFEKQLSEGREWLTMILDTHGTALENRIKQITTHASAKSIPVTLELLKEYISNDLETLLQIEAVMKAIRELHNGKQELATSLGVKIIEEKMAAVELAQKNNAENARRMVAVSTQPSSDYDSGSDLLGSAENVRRHNTQTHTPDWAETNLY